MLDYILSSLEATGYGFLVPCPAYRVASFLDRPAPVTTPYNVVLKLSPRTTSCIQRSLYDDLRRSYFLRISLTLLPTSGNTPLYNPDLSSPRSLRRNVPTIFLPRAKASLAHNSQRHARSPDFFKDPFSVPIGIALDF